MWCLVKILVVQSIYVLLKKFQDVTLDSCPTLTLLEAVQSENMQKKVQPFRGGVCQTSAAGAACSDVIKEQQLQQTEKGKRLVLHHVFLAFH